MTKRALLTVVPVLLVALCAVAPAHAQTFSAEISCTGVFPPGGQVPYSVKLENRTLSSIPLDINISVNVPGRGQFSLINGSLTLGPNQKLVSNRTLNLPPAAPRVNNYTMMITATSNAGETSFDTCSFAVQ